MNIIICDDRIDDRKNLSDLLSDYGEKKNYEFTITEYDSGEQLCEEQSALEACQLLFLDINMQGMDGLKTAMRRMLKMITNKYTIPCTISYSDTKVLTISQIKTKTNIIGNTSNFFNPLSIIIAFPSLTSISLLKKSIWNY